MTSKTRLMPGLLAATLIGVLFVSGGSLGVALADPSVRPPNISASAFGAPANYIVHGAHISPVSLAGGTGDREYYDEINFFNTATGKNLGIVMYFISMTYSCNDGYLPGYINNPPSSKPTTPAVMITWSPFDDGTSTHGPADYDNILNGAYDTVIDNCATALKNRAPTTFLIRFMHEMNLAEWAWYAGQPWNQKADGTGDTAKFIQVWRYVVNRFRNLPGGGPTNVQWVWAPNYASNPSVAWNDYNHYYPGNTYVDWIGLSGYNWSTFRSQPIMSYSTLYTAALTDLQCRYAKPIVHAEFGSVEFSQVAAPTNKANWITEAYSQMQTYPLVRAAVWFNEYAFHNTDDADFRVTNTHGTNYLPLPGHPPTASVGAGITAAYSAAVADSSFTGTFNSSQLLNPPMTRCASDSVSSNGVLGVRPATGLVGRTGTTTTSFAVGALGLSSNTNFTVSGCPNNVTCRFVSSNASTSNTINAPWGGDTLTIVASGSSDLGTFTLTLSGGGASTTVQLTVAQSLSPIYLPLINT